MKMSLLVAKENQGIYNRARSFVKKKYADWHTGRFFMVDYQDILHETHRLKLTSQQFLLFVDYVGMNLHNEIGKVNFLYSTRIQCRPSMRERNHFDVVVASGVHPVYYDERDLVIARDSRVFYKPNSNEAITFKQWLSLHDISIIMFIENSPNIVNIEVATISE